MTRSHAGKLIGGLAFYPVARLVTLGLVWNFIASAQSPSVMPVKINFTGTGLGNSQSGIQLNGSGTFDPIGSGGVSVTATYSGSGANFNLSFLFNLGDGTILATAFATASAGLFSGTATIDSGTAQLSGARGSFAFTIATPPGTTANFVLFTLTGSGNISIVPVAPPPNIIPPNLIPTHGFTCSDPVVVNNGNLLQQRVDLAISSRGPGIVLRRTYNSLTSATDSPFGFGWAHSYGMSIKDNQTSATFVTAAGAAFNFALNGVTYQSPAALNLTLTKDTQGYSLRSSHGTQLRFDSRGVLQSITDPNRNTIQFAYDSTGRLFRINDSLSRPVTLTYDASNHITLVQDFTGRKIVYTYDAAGNLTSVTDAAGNRTQYAYFQDQILKHMLQSVIKPAGNTTSFEYDTNRQVSHVTDSAGRNMRFAYTPSSNKTTFTDPRGFSGTYFYDGLGNITRVVKTDGSSIDTVYTQDARVAARMDESGGVTRYTYDTQGNITSLTDPNGAVTKLTYEPAFNQVASVTDARGAVTRFEYDVSGNLTHVAQPLGVDQRFTYDSFGQLLSAFDPEGNTRTFTYDSSGNPTQSVDPVGNATQYQFDNLRRLTGVTDPLNGKASLQWDALDRVIATLDPLGNATSRSFDPNGNASQSKDANGRITNYSYDALDNLTKVTDAESGVTQYGYAPPDCGCSSGADLVSFRDAAGAAHTEAYDFNERLTQAADSAGNLIAFGYNARGDLIRKTDANGATILYEYDADGRLVRKVFPDATDARFAYDTNGNLISATNANTSVSFTYDELNRVATTTDTLFGKTLIYGYNRNGARTSLTDSESGVTAYTYDANSQLTSVTNPAGASVQFSYDALRRRSAAAYSNGVAAAYQYDAASELTSLTYAAGNSALPSKLSRRSAAAPFLQFAYTYDPSGNTPSLTGLDGTHFFQIDELNRLTGAFHPTVAPESYSYDGAGNRVTSATDSNYAYDGANRLMAAEGATYTYDHNGNLTARADSNGVTTYIYNVENKLTAISFPDGTSAAYLYDALGRRIQKVVNGVVTNYLYDGSDILLELDQAGSLLARYIQGPRVDEPLMMERGGQTYFYQAGKLGSIAALTDGTGNVVCSYSYDSFGRTQTCPSISSPFGFAGREYDVESGLVYMRARYYDPVTGRFISSDPLDLTGLILGTQNGGSALGLKVTPQQLNPYSYAVNNPLRFRDPLGLKCGPTNQRALGDTGQYSIGLDLTHSKNLLVIFDNYGNIVTKGARVASQGTQVVVYDIAGNEITRVADVFKDAGAASQAARTFDFEAAALNKLLDLDAVDDAMSQAGAATKAQIYNTFLDLLDPYGKNPRMPDPLAPL